MLIKSLITLFKQHWQIRECMCMCDGEGGVELPGWFKKMWLVTRDTVEMASNRQLWHDTKWPTLLCHLTTVLRNLQVGLKTSGSFRRFRRTKNSNYNGGHSNNNKSIYISVSTTHSLWRLSKVIKQNFKQFQRKAHNCKINYPGADAMDSLICWQFG